MPTGRQRASKWKQEVIIKKKKKKKNYRFFFLKIVAAETMSGDEHSESEFYYPDELQYQENSKSTALNFEWVGAWQGEGNSQDEIKTFVK